MIVPSIITNLSCFYIIRIGCLQSLDIKFRRKARNENCNGWDQGNFLLGWFMKLWEKGTHRKSEHMVDVISMLLRGAMFQLNWTFCCYWSSRYNNYLLIHLLFYYRKRMKGETQNFFFKGAYLLLSSGLTKQQTFSGAVLNVDIYVTVVC